jgi:hemoglobin-like flavoprotein
MLGPNHIEIVKSTWSRMLGKKRDFDSTFFKILFDLTPGFHEMYDEEKSMHTYPCVVAVNNVIEHIESNDIDTQLNDLGQKYQHYGVTHEHFEMISIAMLLTLERILGRKWNNETRDAWAITLAYVSQKIRYRKVRTTQRDDTTELAMTETTNK